MNAVITTANSNTPNLMYKYTTNAAVACVKLPKQRVCNIAMSTNERGEFAALNACGDFIAVYFCGLFRSRGGLHARRIIFIFFSPFDGGFSSRETRIITRPRYFMKLIVSAFTDTRSGNLRVSKRARDIHSFFGFCFVFLFNRLTFV